MNFPEKQLVKVGNEFKTLRIGCNGIF